MGVCLNHLFLIFTPRFMFGYYPRKFLFIFILFALTYIYIEYESINPLLYGLHLAPITLTLASLFEGLLPGIFTWLAFNLYTLFYLQVHGLPTFAGSTILLIVALALHYKQTLHSTYIKIFFLSLLLVTVYLLGYLSFFGNWEGIGKTEVVIVIAGTYLSSMYISYIYHHIKNQERMREELFRAEKYQVIGQLAASISHEIRNPLTTAQGFLQLMNRNNLSMEQLETYRNYAVSSIEQANAIITDYLNYAKPEVEIVCPLHVQEEIDGTIVPMVSPLCVLSKIEVVIQHFSPEPMYILGESKKFQQSLLNIIKNAVESMPEGGTLKITTWSDNEGVHIHIKDTGVGMSDHQIKRIGMPFYTTKAKGTGLGLMVVISLVKAMNGTISYYSLPNEGTTCVLQYKQVMV